MNIALMTFRKRGELSPDGLLILEESTGPEVILEETKLPDYRSFFREEGSLDSDLALIEEELRPISGSHVLVLEVRNEEELHNTLKWLKVYSSFLRSTSSIHVIANDEELSEQLCLQAADFLDEINEKDTEKNCTTMSLPIIDQEMLQASRV